MMLQMTSGCFNWTECPGSCPIRLLDMQCFEYIQIEVFLDTRIQLVNDYSYKFPSLRRKRVAARQEDTYAQSLLSIVLRYIHDTFQKQG
jgi:hypothetical protein